MVTFIATDTATALFPTDCLLCGSPLTTLARERVCSSCLAAAKAQDEALCTRCGEALGMESARFAAALDERECTACRLAPPDFARAAAFAAYDEEVRELLHLLKFEGHKVLTDRVLGPWLAQAMLQAAEGRGERFVVVPVPMFAARERRRGFNQATLLAAAAIRSLRKHHVELEFTLVPDALERVRDTEALFTLAASQRRRTLRGAFRIAAPERIAGHEVMLVDDIMTTGATARECARVLRRAGAAAVTVATVARAQPEGARAHALWDGDRVVRFGAAESTAVPHGEGIRTHFMNT